jgi:hypothetical protein
VARADATVHRGLSKWPTHIHLLAIGAGMARHAGDAAAETVLLQRAVSTDPHDARLRHLLRRASMTGARPA